MDFDLNDEQRQLKDSLERLLNDTYGDLNKRHGYMKEAKGYSAALWKQYAELGLLAVPFAEEHGGLGQGLTETMILAEAFGRALAIEPYLATIVLSGGALRHAGNAALLEELVPAIVEGKMTLALAHQERQARYDIADTATTARADGKGGYTLEGEKNVVLHGDHADKLHRHGARAGRPHRPRRHRPVPGRRQGQRPHAPRLSHPGRHARSRRDAVGRPRRPRGRGGGARQGARGAGARRRRGHCRAVRPRPSAPWPGCTS